MMRQSKNNKKLPGGIKCFTYYINTHLSNYMYKYQIETKMDITFPQNIYKKRE